MNETVALYRDRKADSAETLTYIPGDFVHLPTTQIMPASTLLAEAFHNSPVLVKLFPDTSTRTSLLPLFFNFIVR